MISVGANIGNTDIIINNLVQMDNSMFEYLLSNGYQPNLATTELLVQNDKFDKIRLCHKYGIDISDETYNIASKKGNLEILQWLYDNNIEYSHDHFNVLCFSQHDKMVEVAKLQQKYHKLDIETAFDNFVLIDSIEGLEYLKTLGHQIPLSSIQLAAKKGKLVVLEWVKKNQIDIPPDVFAHAASGDQIEVMVWISKNGYTCNIMLAWELAARYGSLNAMKLLYNNSYHIPLFSHENILYLCAFSGHLESLKWLKSVYSIEWYGNPELNGAACGGRLEILKWYKSIAPLSNKEIKKIFICAMQERYIHIFDWLCEEKLWQTKFDDIVQNSSDDEVMAWCSQKYSM